MRVSSCSKEIETLEKSLEVKRSQLREKSGVRKASQYDDKYHLSRIIHYNGVMMVLYARLKSITATLEQKQHENCRYRQIMEQSKSGSITLSSLLMSLPDLSESPVLKYSTSEYHLRKEDKSVKEDGVRGGDVDEGERRLMHRENKLLKRKLETELDEVRTMHFKMTEIASTCSFLSSKVQEQHWQVERLNNTATVSTDSLKKSKVQLREASENKKSSRAMSLYFFIIMGISVLFLDWYQE